MEEAIAQLINSRQRFLLTGHEHPDGDCLGAQVALYHLLTALGKEVWIVNPDPVGKSLDFLLEYAPIDRYRADMAIPAVDVVMLLDCAQLDRVGDLGRRLRELGAVIAVIDHHVGSEDGDGEVDFVDSTAAATGAMVHRLYRRFGVPVSTTAAEGVFVSLVSDTGWFRYSNTDPSVLTLAGELVAGGVDVARLYDRINRRLHPDAVPIISESLATSQFRFGDRFAYACMDRGLMDRVARAGFDTDDVLEPLRSVEGIEVVALFKERFDGVVKLSLRASGDIDVRAIAAEFGGGGHRKAAGATMPMPLTESVAEVERLVGAALRNGKPGESA